MNEQVWIIKEEPTTYSVAKVQTYWTVPYQKRAWYASNIDSTWTIKGEPSLFLDSPWDDTAFDYGFGYQ